MKDASGPDDANLLTTQVDPGPGATIYIAAGGRPQYPRFRLFWTDEDGKIEPADTGTYSLGIYEIDRRQGQGPARIGYLGRRTDAEHTNVAAGEEVVFGPVTSGIFAFRVYAKNPDSPDHYLCQVYVE